MKTSLSVASAMLALLVWSPILLAQSASAPVVFNYDYSRPKLRWKAAAHGQDVIVMATVPKGHEMASLYLENASHTVATAFVPRLRGYFGFSVNKDELASGKYTLIISFKNRQQPSLQVGTLIVDDDFTTALTQRSGTDQQHYKTALSLASTTLATVPITTSSEANGSPQALDEIGTGLIVSASGVLVTCDHVVRNAKRITFRYRDALYTAVPFPNKYTDRWSARDITVLKATKMPPGGFVTAYLASSHDVDDIVKYMDYEEDNGPLNWMSLGYPALEPTTMRSLNVESWRIRNNVASFSRSHIIANSSYGMSYKYQNAFEVTWRGLRDDSELDGMSGGPLLTETGYVIGILESAGVQKVGNRNSVRGVFIPVSLVIECLLEMASADSSLEWPIAHPVVPEKAVANLIHQNSLWADLLTGLEASSHNLPHEAATKFLAVLSKANSSNDPSNTASSAALEALRSLGETAIPEINSFLVSSFDQSELPRGQIIPSLLLLSAKNSALPRGVLAHALEQQRPWAVQQSALTAIYSIGNLGLVTPNELDAIWRFATLSSMSANTMPVNALGTDGNRAEDNPTPLAIYTLGRLIYNPQGIRYDGLSRSGLSVQDKDIDAFIFQKLQDANYANSCYAAKSIRDAHDMTAFNQLLSMVSSNTEELAKMRLVDAIGFIGFDQGVDVLQSLVIPPDQSVTIRHHALLSLSKIGGKRAEVVLGRVLLEQNSGSAVVALGRLGGQFAVDTLQRAFFETNSTSPYFLDNILHAIKSAESNQGKTTARVLLNKINGYAAGDTDKFNRLKKSYDRVYGHSAST